MKQAMFVSKVATISDCEIYWSCD